MKPHWVLAFLPQIPDVAIFSEAAELPARHLSLRSCARASAPGPMLAPVPACARASPAGRHCARRSRALAPPLAGPALALSPPLPAPRLRSGLHAFSRPRWPSAVRACARFPPQPSNPSAISIFSNLHFFLLPCAIADGAANVEPREKKRGAAKRKTSPSFLIIVLVFWCFSYKQIYMATQSHGALDHNIILTVNVMEDLRNCEIKLCTGSPSFIHWFYFSEMMWHSSPV